MRDLIIIKVGVFGIGRMGKLNLLNTQKMKNVKIIAVADKNKRRLNSLKIRGLTKYEDCDELLENEDIDAVIISLPNYLKKETIIKSAKKGIDIYVDKPLARNFKEASTINHTVTKQNVRLVVGSNCRFFDCVKSVKGRVDEGSIGDIVLSNFELVINGPFSHPLNPHPIPEWYFKKELAGGGAILDLGYHLIDLMQWFLGDLEVLFSVLGYKFGLPVEDNGTIVLRSKNTATIGTINVGWFCKELFPRYNFRLNFHGTAGNVSTDQFTPRNLYIHAIKEGLKNAVNRVLLGQINYLSYTYYMPSYYQMLKAFFASIVDNTSSPIELDSQIAVMQLIDNVYAGNGVHSAV